ncbi:MAG: nuclear transport factor 2 family protein [Azoarcus sp.]|nr:nuclear transport factor 2 family protein [Azoarcus sp.]
MENAPVTIVSDTDYGNEMVRIVDTYLRTIMIPDPDGARAFVAPDMRIRFTGGREMRDPRECTAFNRGRYAKVQKKFERYEVVAGASEAEAIVYSLGTLYGEWPDGTPFEGNRYVDRYVLRNGKIVLMEVWNDSAEWLLERAGITA